jgi:hypothetical protein
MQPTCRNSKLSHGSRPNEETRYTSLPIPQLENCYTRNTCKRRMYSKLPARLRSWRSTAESSIWTDYRKSSCQANRSSVSCHSCVVGYLQADVQMSSIREREKSSKVKTSQKSDRDTTRMVRVFTRFIR